MWPFDLRTIRMKVYFHEIKDHDLEYHFDENTAWVMEVIGSLDERMDQVTRPPNWKPRSRPTAIHFNLRRVDDLIHVTGKVDTQLYLLCSLCADPFQFPIHLKFHTLLTQTELYGESPREMSHSSRVEAGGGADADEIWDTDEEDDDDEDSTPAMDLNSSDFEVTVVKEPVVNLKEILNEQVVLTLPMQPKPECNASGDCIKCNRNQNSFSLEAKETLKENPFAVLKKLKLQK
jgi:uncharacterized metal-binding protein YceD (DUF177 family)